MRMYNSPAPLATLRRVEKIQFSSCGKWGVCCEQSEIKKEYGEMTIHLSITSLISSRLWIIRWAVRLAGATIVVCKAKPRKEKEKIA